MKKRGRLSESVLNGIVNKTVSSILEARPIFGGIGLSDAEINDAINNDIETAHKAFNHLLGILVGNSNPRNQKIFTTIRGLDNDLLVLRKDL